MQTPSAPTSLPQSPQLSAVADPSLPVSRSSTLPVPGPHHPQLRTDSSGFRPPSGISVPASVASSDDGHHSGKSWARQVDDPWAPMIMTCDGGGIRGYSSLLIIKQLMHEVAVWENFLEQREKPVGQRMVFREEELLPCHYFDFMYGTSTGGLIATLLGRLRMPVPVCLEIYKEVGHQLFGRRRSNLPLATKYDHEPLERAVKRIVQTHCPIEHRGSKLFHTEISSFR